MNKFKPGARVKFINPPSKFNGVMGTVITEEEFENNHPYSNLAYFNTAVKLDKPLQGTNYIYQLHSTCLTVIPQIMESYND